MIRIPITHVNELLARCNIGGEEAENIVRDYFSRYPDLQATENEIQWWTTEVARQSRRWCNEGHGIGQR